MEIKIETPTWGVIAWNNTSDRGWPLACYYKFAVVPERIEAGGVSSWSGSGIEFRTLDEAKALHEVLGKLIASVEE